MSAHHQQLNHDDYSVQQLQQRQVPSVPEPAWRPPTDEQFFLPNNLPNAPFLREHFLAEGRLTENQALYLLERAGALLATEPNLLELNGAVTICGDIHGQYYDLMKLFEVGGTPGENAYLFLGDYVDRGCFGIECLLYLYALKLTFPNRILLLRGNHECRHLTEYFTFKRECIHKYSEAVYESAVRSFLALPVAALVDGRFFCVHGGISPELGTLDDVRRLDRFQEPGSHGLLCDLLWADPIANFGHEHEPGPHGPPHPPGTQFLHNEMRGCSYYYTFEAACKFLERNGLLSIIRGHEAQDAGYTMHRKQPNKKFPSVITIFSAPNYLDVYRNRGAVLKYVHKSVTIRQYNWSPHPYWLPNFMDAFTWSLPFVGAKIIEMLLSVLAVCTEEELEVDAVDMPTPASQASELVLSPSELAARREQIKAKILTIGRMQRVFQLLREETENAAELAAEDAVARVDPNGQITQTLGVSGNQIRRYIRSFDDARRSDIANERLPEFDPSQPAGDARAPSMRPGLARTTTMEELIRQTLAEEGGPETVERLAANIAEGGYTRPRQGYSRYG